MAITFRSHQVDIGAYANDLREELNQVEGNSRDSIYDWLDRQLDLTTWTSNKDGWKAEVLITYGGPTVTIELDSRYTFGTLRHSWGANATTGEDQTSVEFEHSGLTDAICEIRGLG